MKMFKNLCGWMYAFSGWFMCCGFYKILYYNVERKKNAYVGGDAYNYIINSTTATGYFVLALLFTIIGCTMLGLYFYTKNNKQQIEIEDEQQIEGE